MFGALPNLQHVAFVLQELTCPKSLDPGLHCSLKAQPKGASKVSTFSMFVRKIGTQSQQQKSIDSMKKRADNHQKRRNILAWLPLYDPWLLVWFFGCVLVCLILALLVLLVTVGLARAANTLES